MKKIVVLGSTGSIGESALRVAVPIALNEVPVQEGGRTKWVVQQAWVYGRLAAAGLPTPPRAYDPRFLPVVEQVCRDHPTWCVPYLLLSQGLVAAGRPEEAQQAHDTAMALETDRAVFEGYMQRLRRVGADEKAAVFDVESELAPYVAGKPMMQVVALFSDFVHLRARAQALVGVRLCGTIEKILAERSGP